MHTEESLMRLVNEALNTAEKAEADHCSALGRDLQQSNANAREAEAALRLAIREVLAERDERPTKRLWDETATALETLRVKFHNVNAECERNRKDAERYRWLVADPIGWDEGDGTSSFILNRGDRTFRGTSLDAAIDAAMQEKQP